MKLKSLSSISHNSSYVPVVLLVVFASIIHLYQLGAIPLSLYYDEVTSVYFPFLYFRGEMTLPIVSVLISIVTGTLFIYALAGPSAFWARFPSAVYGVLFVVVCWALGKKLYGQKVGIIAGLLASVVPWSFHFSRYGVVCCISYAFYVALAVYLLVSYFQTGKDHFKFGAFVVIGVSLYTHAMALVFDLLFFPVVIFAGFILSRTSLRRMLVNMLLFFTMFLIFASPFLASYLFMAGQFPFTKYTTVERSTGIFEIAKNVVERAYMHLSPDFLVISGGKSFLTPNGSGEFIPQAGLYFNGTAGKVGILNAYGVFVYLGFLWLIYEIVRRQRVDFKRVLIIWWIALYAIASGFAYYDNPNAARNIVGLPAFILVISLVINKVWFVLFDSGKGYISRRVFRSSFPVKTLKCLFLIALIVPSIYYFAMYFMTYRSSYDYFDYDYRLLSDYLTENKLWNNNIVLNESRPDKWYGSIVLSFYNYSASEKIVMGDLPTAFSLLRYRKSIVVYVTRDMSNQSGSSSLFYCVLLGIIHYPDNTPVFAVWKINRL